MNWLARLFRRNALDRDLERELQFHLDAQTEDFIGAGMSPTEARRRARVALGGVEQVKEAARDTRGTRWLEDWVADTRYALRTMARTPGFTLAAILTLAAGVGANTAVWSIVDALMLRSLPISRPEELHAIRRVGIEAEYLISHPTMQRMQAAVSDNVRLAAMASSSRLYADFGERVEPINAQLVSGTWFPVLGVRAEIGRTLSPADDRTLGGHPVAVLSNGYWRRRFGADSTVVGRTFRLNGTSMTIIGVAERGFNGLTVGTTEDLWAPLMMQHELRYKSNASSISSDTELPWVPQPGVSWLTLITSVPRAEAPRIGARLDGPFRVALEEVLAREDSAARAHGMREHVELEPISRGFSGLRQAFREPLRVLMASVAIVLLIACGNLAGLQLARGAARSQEFAVRVSLGARPGRLARQVLTESVTLAAMGGAVGLLVAHWGSKALLRLASTGTNAVPLDVSLDARVLAFAFGVAIVTGLLFGLAPALRIARADLYERFRAGGRVFARGATHRLPLGRALVAAQIALSVVLVAAALLFVRTFQNLLDIDVGYERELVLHARLDVRAAGYSKEQLPALYQRLVEAVRAVPGVRSASLSLYGLAGGARRTAGFTIPGRTFGPGESSGQENFATPDFFATVGLPIVRGRVFTEQDRDGAPRVAIVSETFARHFFGTSDVIGARFGYGTPPEFEIVGVVRDARVNSVRETPKRLAFYPLAQGPQEYITSLEARVVGSPTSTGVGIRNAIASVDRNLPLREVVSIGHLLERGLVRERLVARLAGGFGVLALVLAGIGLYGVMGYSVTRRTNEMGLRLALGASPSNVLWVVLRESLRTIAVGLAIGVALWLPLVVFARRLVYGLSPHDPATLALAAGLLLTAGAVAGVIPAWRASRIDPLEAIRSE